MTSLWLEIQFWFNSPKFAIFNHLNFLNTKVKYDYFVVCLLEKGHPWPNYCVVFSPENFRHVVENLQIKGLTFYLFVQNFFDEICLDKVLLKISSMHTLTDMELMVSALYDQIHT